MLVQFVWPFIHIFLSAIGSSYYRLQCSKTQLIEKANRLIENHLNAHAERQEHPQEGKFIMDFLVQHDFVVVSPRMPETQTLCLSDVVFLTSGTVDGFPYTITDTLPAS